MCVLCYVVGGGDACVCLCVFVRYTSPIHVYPFSLLLRGVESEFEAGE